MNRLLILVNIFVVIVIIIISNHAKEPIVDNQEGTNIEESEGTEIEPVETEPEFFSYKKLNNRVNEDSLYADIINHCNDPYLTADRDTNAHETTHGINSDVRNSNEVRNSYGASRQVIPGPIVKGKRINAFYVGYDKVAILVEPDVKKNDAIPFIPENLRGYRFSLYLAQQQMWNDIPLYLFDEWTAYINGGTVSVDDAEKSGKHAWTDAVMGGLEFSIYSIALAMAIEEKDHDYWENNTQFRSFLSYSLKKSENLFKRGKKYFPFEQQDKLLSNLKNDPSAAKMRDFINKYLDGVWLDGETSGEYEPLSHEFDGFNKIVLKNGKKTGIRFDLPLQVR